MGGLHGDPRSFSAPLFVLFWGGGLSPLRCLFSKNLPLGGLYGDSRFFSTPPLVLFWAGESVFSPLSMRCCFVLLLYGAWGALLVMFFVVFGRLGRRFGFAVNWLCECRLSHLAGGVNKKNTLPGGRPAKVEPAGACVRGAGEPQSGGQ